MRTMPLILLAGIAALGLAPTIAQKASAPTTPGQPVPGRVTSGTYAADPYHTLVGWRVSHMGFNDYFGQFGNARGTLVLDAKMPNKSKLDITIPISSLSAANADLIKHLLGTDFFDAGKFAEARFVSTSVRAKGTSAIVIGNLTLKGITKPVTLNVRFAGAGKMVPQGGGKETVGFHATGTINRADFGLDYGLGFVPDPVKLDITAAFEKQD